MRVLAVLPFVAVTSCALVSGLDDLTIGSDDGGASADGGSDSTSDAPADAKPDTAAFDGGCADAGCAGVGAPWAAVGYTESACPAGWGSNDVVTNPALGTACTCGCSVTTPPKCDVGTCATAAGTSPSCSLATINLNFNGGNCVSLPGQGAMLAPFQKITPLAPTGGSCTAAPATSGVTSTAAHLCVPPDCTTAAALCSASSATPTGVSHCVSALGDLACPSTHPVRHLVGATAVAACTNGCTCKVDAACQMPKVSFYSDDKCGVLVIASDATGTCVADPASGTMVRSAKYTASVSSTCTPSGAPSGTVSLTGTRTVCCTP